MVGATFRSNVVPPEQKPVTCAPKNAAQERCQDVNRQPTMTVDCKWQPAPPNCGGKHSRREVASGVETSHRQQGNQQRDRLADGRGGQCVRTRSIPFVGDAENDEREDRGADDFRTERRRS